MDRYLHHVTLTTGHSRRSWRHEVDPTIIARLADLLECARHESRALIPYLVPPCWLYLDETASCALMTVRLEDDVPLITLVVASHAVCGAQLWHLLHETAQGPLATRTEDRPNEPWCGVRIEVGASSVPLKTIAMLADLERCLAWAWLEPRYASLEPDRPERYDRTPEPAPALRGLRSSASPSLADQASSTQEASTMTKLIAKASDFMLSHRISFQRTTLLGAFIFTLFSPPARSHGALGEMVEISGFVLLCAAALGQLWCVAFTGEITKGSFPKAGPYSVVRNPLYLFNVIGALGVGLAMLQPALAAVLPAIFAIYYSVIVRREEQVLFEVFGAVYRGFQQRTPRWIPRLSQYVEPPAISIDPVRIRHGIVNSMGWLWLFGAWEMVEHMHVAI